MKDVSLSLPGSMQPSEREMFEHGHAITSTPTIKEGRISIKLMTSDRKCVLKRFLRNCLTHASNVVIERPPVPCKRPSMSCRGHEYGRQRSSTETHRYPRPPGERESSSVLSSLELSNAQVCEPCIRALLGERECA